MRVLVIGGAGLLGTHLAPLLEEAGHEVALCDNFSGSLKFRTPDNYRIFTSNVVDLNATQHPFRIFNPEIVILSVSYFFPRDVIYNFYDDVKLVLDSANVISSVLSRDVKHVYLCSGHEVYGGPQTNRPLKETRKIRTPATHHGTAEFSAENILKFRCRELSIPYTVLRIFDLYGPRIQFSPRTGVVSFLIDSFLRDDAVGLVSPRKKRDFIHVEDAAFAISQVIKSEYEGIVNIGTGKGTTIKKFCIELLKEIRPSDLPQEVNSRIEAFSSIADTAVLSSLIKGGWKPKHDVLSDLKDLIEFREKELHFATRSNPVSVLNAMRGIANV